MFFLMLIPLTLFNAVRSKKREKKKNTSAYLSSSSSPLESKGIPERRSTSALPSHHPRCLCASQLFAICYIVFQTLVFRHSVAETKIKLFLVEINPFKTCVVRKICLLNHVTRYSLSAWSFSNKILENLKIFFSKKQKLYI